MPFPVMPNDQRIHLFSISDGPVKLAHQTYLSRLDRAAEGTPLAEALGAAVDATYAEVFAVRDVEPMGLRAYLAQAHDIPEAALEGDAARLDALSGDVLVLAPRALDGVDVLNPSPELTHIGSYAPAEADNSPRDLPPAVKEPSAVAPVEPPTMPALSNRVIMAIVVAGLALAAVLFLW